MSLAVRTGLFNALSASSALKAIVGERIYHQQAPEGARFPYVIFAKSAGTKTRALKVGAQIKRDVWLVKVIDRSTSSKVAEEAADAIDALLDEGAFTVSGKTVIDVHHVGDIEYVENDGDQEYRHTGGRYGVVVT